MDEQAVILALRVKEHEGWARWMDYLLGKFPRAANGDVVLPAGYVAALERQIATPYEALTPEEQQADGDEVAHILPIIRQHAAAFARSHIVTQFDGAPAATLPTRLRWLRKKRGWTLGDLAAITGLSISYLSDLERGARGVLPALETLQRIADCYGLALGELLVNVRVREHAEAGG